MSEVVEVPLTQGKVALIDAIDLDRVSQHKWRAVKWSSGFYAETSVYDGEKFVNVRMHRFIVDAPDDTDVDHIDHDGLNNTRDNLRVCSRNENLLHRRPKEGFTVRGVYFYPTVVRKGKRYSVSKPWVANIQKDHKRIYLGSFKTRKEAAEAYNKAAISLFGEFAYLNEI